MTDPLSEPAGIRRHQSAQVLYTAELAYRNGAYTLTVQDHAHGSQHTTAVTPRMINMLPAFLAKLGTVRRHSV
ncbi:hypothetical protein [Streptomyces tauricus]|uniref:hypothetical protein n=1 Tax=Streptomyces tauricus TaxID=68274 RepID=UPI003810A325